MNKSRVVIPVPIEYIFSNGTKKIGWFWVGNDEIRRRCVAITYLDVFLKGRFLKLRKKIIQNLGIEGRENLLGYLLLGSSKEEAIQNLQEYQQAMYNAFYNQNNVI